MFNLFNSLFNVTDNPLINIIPNQNVIRLNHSDSLNITCSVDSFPIQYGFWKHLDEQYLNTFPYQERSITYESYLVSNLKRSDNGSYACCLQNDPNVCESVDVIVQSSRNFTFLFCFKIFSNDY